MAEAALLARVTCADRAEAHAIARVLIEERLAACVHLTDHASIYRWQGAIHTEAEVTLLAKTTQAAFARLRDRVLDLHSHDVPGIIAVAIIDGHAPFLDWIAAAVV
jgi:periplasmic divalent cation tolerance protein